MLAEVVSTIATGRSGALFSEPKEKAEWGKKLTSILLNGPAVVIIDNVAQRLDSDDLCKTLTAEVHADRAMATHQTMTARCSLFLDRHWQ